MALFHKHLKLSTKERLSPWRKVSLSSWRPTGDSTIGIFEDIEVDRLLLFCRQSSLSINTVLIKALSIALRDHPRVNSIIRFGQIFNRHDNGIFLHVLSQKGYDDLGGFSISNAYQLSLTDIQSLTAQNIDSIQHQTDAFSQTKKIFSPLPVFLVKWMMNSLSFILYKLNLTSSLFKVPKDPFGSIMLTSVGSLGIQQALCPIAPYTHNSMVVSVGKIRQVPLAVDGAVVIRSVITLGFTFDHRIIDGIQFKHFFHSFRQALHTMLASED